MMRSPARLAGLLAAAGALALLAGFAAGGEGFSGAFAADRELIATIRAPRTLGAWCVGALLGLAGAIAQGLFRNPLADPYLLGSAAGAGLGVTGVLAAGLATGLAGSGLPAALGQVGGAFVGALAGVGLAIVLAGGAGRPLRLLLAGVVVGVLLGALADLLLLLVPEALRARQAFLLGSTAMIGWDGCALLAAVLALALPAALALARGLDALVLGEAAAASLGLPLPRLRTALVMLMALATGAAVAQAGLVAFVGLLAPHLVRRAVVSAHRARLALAALAGGALLTAADVAARTLVAPRELPVGLLTAVLGGVFLLRLLHRQAEPGAAR